MARLVTLEVKDRKFYIGGREIFPGRIHFEDAIGSYILGQDRVQRLSGTGLWVYTYIFPGEGFYRIGPIFAQKMNRAADESDDPGTFYHPHEEDRREGCTHWSHWFTMTQGAKACFLEAFPGHGTYTNGLGQRISHPDVICGTSGYFEWAAKNLEQFRAYLAREHRLNEEAKLITAELLRH